MVRVELRVKGEGLAAKVMMQVHDELIVECPEPQAEAAAKLLEEEMELAGERFSVARIPHDALATPQALWDWYSTGTNK